jgi:ATP-binding cassette, subfamily G (WHITE), member 2, PDR
MICDLPYKITNGILLNLTLYFMGNLRREPGAFFFLLFSLMMTLTMSMMFRLIGSVTKSLAQALAPASIVLLGITLYAGFAIPPPYMERWIR